MRVIGFIVYMLNIGDYFQCLMVGNLCIMCTDIVMVSFLYLFLFILFNVDGVYVTRVSLSIVVSPKVIKFVGIFAIDREIEEHRHLISISFVIVLFKVK